MGKSITILVPAYNEEKNLENAVKKFDTVVKNFFDDYEIIVFNDCSSDRTGEIGNALAKKNKRVRVVHNKKNMGIGYNFREGVKLSEKDYFMYLPGEGEVLSSSLERIFKHVGEADLIIPYIKNSEIREPYRQVISSMFTNLMNIFFGMHIKYYNGCGVQPTKLLKKIKLTTNSAAFQAEAVVRLLKQGHSYVEVPYEVKESDGSTCIRLKNLIKVAITILRLFLDVTFGGNR